MSEHASNELGPPTTPLKRGSKGSKVRQVQEWLTLHGHGTAIDGNFGPATEAALKAFQEDMEDDSGGIDGICNAATWAALTEPMRRVVEWERDPPLSLGREIVTCAYAHLDAHSREVGGHNAGPWVRYYCRGQEVPWCAGFATTVLGQALGHDGWFTLSCDALAARAQDCGLLRRANETRPVRPGDLFLIRTPGLSMVDWVHTGIVTAVGDGYFETVEGNTNAGGSREGTAVHSRTRAFGPHVDFVLIGDR